MPTATTRAPEVQRLASLGDVFFKGYSDRLEGLCLTKPRKRDLAAAYVAGYAAASLDLQIFGKPDFGTAFKAWLTIHAGEPAA
ncbi:hypothetical protein M5E06_21095 [Azospirillum sp. A1-3]|uniref:hypothetical protein n=1 Tax=Azospirillum sp. A1-3 TaxID=185874 RepID=UPI0020771D76|nr:hypothetical protein [Azospirillum sp. A1-3]MCM8736627.1 hypothetical protein [Azospirillum sp. A1-3]